MSSVLFDEVTLLHPFSRLYISCHHYNWWSQRRFSFVRLHTLNKISLRKRDFYVLPIWARSYQVIVKGEGLLSHNFIQNIKGLSPPSHKWAVPPSLLWNLKEWKRGRSLQHALVLQTFNEQYQGSPLYWPFPPRDLGNSCPLDPPPLN